MNDSTIDSPSAIKPFLEATDNINLSEKMGSGLNHIVTKRLHPIYKVFRKHTGTDYAAIKGTSIKAGSDGVVTYIGRKGGYGKMITIKHNKKYSTLYGHMNGYAKGLEWAARSNIIKSLATLAPLATRPDHTCIMRLKSTACYTLNPSPNLTSIAQHLNGPGYVKKVLITS